MIWRTWIRQGLVPRSHVDDTNNIINNNERYSRPAKRAIPRGEEVNIEERRRRRGQTTTKEIGGQTPLTSCTRQTQEGSNRKKREDK